MAINSQSAKIEKLERDLIKSVDDKHGGLDKRLTILEELAVRRDALVHYVSYRVLVAGFVIGLAFLAGAYAYITPMVVAKENSEINEKLDGISQAIERISSHRR